jgi:hypothetical protein
LAGVVLGQTQILDLNRERAVLEAINSYMNGSIASIENDIQTLQIQLGSLSPNSLRLTASDPHVQQIITLAQRRIQAAFALLEEILELSKSSRISGVHLIQKRLGLGAGNVASACMVLGIQLFGASLCAFAISTQPKRVWIPVVSVFGAAIVLYYLLRFFAARQAPLQLFKVQRRKRHNPIALREEPEQAKIKELAVRLSEIMNTVSCGCSRVSNPYSLS